MRYDLRNFVALGKVTRFLGSLLMFNFFFGLILFGFFRWLLFGAGLIVLFVLSLLWGQRILFKPFMRNKQTKNQTASSPQQQRSHKHDDIIDVEAEIVD